MSAKKGIKKNSSDFYYPSEEIKKNANVQEYDKMYKSSIRDREKFWAEQAAELSWFKKWNKVLDDKKAPFYKWFTGGKINIVHNAIDRHLQTWRRNKLALSGKVNPEIFEPIPIMHSIVKYPNLPMC